MNVSTEYVNVDPVRPVSTRTVLLVVGVPILFLIPFVDKAFHIDDPIFLWPANRILNNPFDFFGFEVNWYGWYMPMFEVNKNPPGVSYFIALVALLFGGREIALHLGFLLPAAGVALGTYYLARTISSRPVTAVLAAVITPAFLVSATSVMSDVFMLAFYVWAVYFWVQGLEKKNAHTLILSSLLMALASLMKFFGVSLIPLLAAYSLAKTRRLVDWPRYFLIPILILAGYNLATHLMYGTSQFSGSAMYSVRDAGTSMGFWMDRIIKTFSFSGGGLIGILFFLPFLWSSRQWLAGAGLTLTVLALGMALGIPGDQLIYEAEGINWGFLVQYTVFIGAGIHLLILAISDAMVNKSPVSLLLLLWILGTVFFAAFLNWHVSVRTILPMAPAAGILVARRLERFHCGQTSTPAVWVPLSLAAVIALGVTWADYSWANSVKAFVQKRVGSLTEHSSRVWFQGHWGFQVYMEMIGGQSIDVKKQMFREGDWIINPMNNTNIGRMVNDRIKNVGTYYADTCSWLAINHPDLGAGFYSSLSGPLPYAFGSVPPDQYEVYRFMPRS